MKPEQSRLARSPRALSIAAAALALAAIVALAAASRDSLAVAIAAAVVGAAAVTLLAAISLARAASLDRTGAERRRLADRVVALADRDPLTGLYNRARLDDELHRQLAFAQRYSRPLAVVRLELEGFEEVAEAYGPAAGDELLITVAETLADDLRASDVICRPGGIEFVVLLPQSGEEVARIVAGKLIRSLRALRRPRPVSGLVALRPAVGIAISSDGWQQPAELFAAAGEALEAARTAGGDRLAVAAHQLPGPLANT